MILVTDKPMAQTGRLHAGAGLVALSLLTVGCGAADVPELYPVTGKAMRDGRPLVGATVYFESVQDSNVSAVGEVQADGTFELQTAVVGLGEHVPGALAGRHRISVQIESVGESGDPLNQEMGEHVQLDETVEVSPDSENHFELEVPRQGT